MFGRVPMLPVVVPMAVVLFALMIWVLQPSRTARTGAGRRRGGSGRVRRRYRREHGVPDLPGVAAVRRSRSAPLNLMPVVGYEVGDAVTNALVCSCHWGSSWR